MVDVFGSDPLSGNPLAVVVDSDGLETQEMERITRWMNLSETAFLLRRDDESFSLRWFTPAVEVALCGHATLASAHALWEERILAPATQARFHTKSGLLTADRRGDLIELDFPATREERADPPAGLLEALGVDDPIRVGKNKFDYIVEVASENAVRAIAPDHARLRTIPVRGIIVTSRAGGGDIDFVSRFFAPGSGVDEDPVTGSAHCCLAPYWSERLGKNEMVGFQASARGGVVRVRVEGDRVKLGGRAVTVLRGELAV